ALGDGADSRVRSNRLRQGARGDPRLRRGRVRRDGPVPLRSGARALLREVCLDQFVHADGASRHGARRGNAMVAASRTTARAVDQLGALGEAPHRFGFFAALRQLECLYADKPRIGRAARPGDEPVRLGQSPSLSFAPASIAEFRPGGAETPSYVGVYFFGLFGPNGPLPLH